MKRVLVTGSQGQLARSIQKIASKYPDLAFSYTDIQDLDITDRLALKQFLAQEDFDYCINCAAYTAVDKAEEEKEKAYGINTLGPQNLAEVCTELNVVLIHISTDFVFDGAGNQLYKEEDPTLPLSVYGQSKLDGEKAIEKAIGNYFVIRTSWLYSEFGDNFMITMLRLGKERKELNIVNDQFGSPTYAEDLAHLILDIIEKRNCDFGLYHYSNEGIISWYEFAKEIFSLAGIQLKLNPIASSDYPTAAKRPAYSALDHAKIKRVLNPEIFNWKKSLKRALSNYHDD